MDSSFLHQVIQLRHPWLDDVMLLASALGAAGFIWWVTAFISMVFPAKRAAAWRLLLAVGFTWIVAEYALTPAIDRARPYQVDTSLVVIDAKPTTASFPSGHAAMAVAGAMATARMLPTVAPVWWLVAAIVAVSRVYIGVHWPSDVLAGALLGIGTGWFVLGGKTNYPINPPIQPH